MLTEKVYTKFSSSLLDMKPVKASFSRSEEVFYRSRITITFANSLDPDQDGHSVGPDLDPSCLTR